MQQIERDIEEIRSNEGETSFAFNSQKPYARIAHYQSFNVNLS